MNTEEEKLTIDRLINAAHLQQKLVSSDIDKFNKYVESAVLYNSESPEDLEEDWFPDSAISLYDFIDTYLVVGEEFITDFEILSNFSIENLRSNNMNSGVALFLRKYSSTDGRTAWFLIHGEIMGQCGCDENLVDVFVTLLEAEASLRKRGYIFPESPPSGSIDKLTDKKIIVLVRKAILQKASA